MQRERFRAQLLSGAPATSSVGVVQRLLAVQAQDPRGARLAIRARSTVPGASAIDRAFSEDRSLLITWLNRGTLHLVTREDYPWLLALTTPQLRTGNARRLQQLGVNETDAARGVAVIRRDIDRHGPRTRIQLGDSIRAAGIGTDGQALIHLLFRAAIDGEIIRGPMAGIHHAYVRPEEWLGPGPRIDHDAALGELARRYLRGHAPATDRDLAKWAGITLGQARSALQRISAEVEEHGGVVWLRGSNSAAERALPPPRLLGVFDPVLHGWTSREAVLGAHEPVIVTGGMFRTFVLAGGHCVGDWRWERKRAVVRLLEPVAAAVEGAVEADARAVETFLTT